MREGVIAYCKGRDAPSCCEELRGFIDRYRSSAYAPAMTRSLADAAAYGHCGIQPNYDLAIRLYQQFLDRWPDHANTPWVMFYLIMALDRAGRSAEGSRVLIDFEKRFPEQEQKRKATRAALSAE